MPAFANIVLADGQTTPVNHTFAPVTIDQSGVAVLADRSSGIAIGFPVLTMLVRPSTKTSRNYKVSAKVIVPTLEVTSPSTATGIQPAPTKAYDCMATIEFVMPERSTSLERQNLLAYMKNLLINTVLTNGVVNFETIY